MTKAQIRFKYRYESLISYEYAIGVGMMLNIWKWKIGVFFSKTGDFETYTNQKGIRIVFNGKNEFWDIYLYPRIFVYKCVW